MTHFEAVLTLMREGRNDRFSKAALGRIRRSCRALGFSREETAQVERYFEYRNESGTLLPGYEEEAR